MVSSARDESNRSAAVSNGKDDASTAVLQNAESLKALPSCGDA
jgi:hypothetical protein